MNLRWSWHPPLRDLFESIDPARWATVGRTRSRAAPAVEPDELERLAADPALRRARRRQGGPRPLPRRGPLVPAVGPGAGRGSPSAIAYFSAGVRHHRGRCRSTPAASASSPATTSRRLRHRRADRRRRPVLQDRLLPPEPQPRRLAAGGLPGARPRRAAPVAAARGGRHAGPGRPSSCPAAASCTPTCGAPQVGRVPLLLLDSDVHGNDDGRPQRHRAPLRRRRRARACSRRCCSAMGGVRALRLGRGSPAPRPRTSTTPTRATPASSASSGSASSSRRGHVVRRGARGRAVGDGLHDAHPGAGRHRPLRRLAHRAVLRRRAGAGGRARRAAAARSAPRPTRVARPASSTWPSWACASPSAPTASRSCTAS